MGFTSAATELARRDGVLVEGEIGSIDGAGPRKWNKTTPGGFARFVEQTGLDLVMAHVGQFHSIDYGFDATRRALAGPRPDGRPGHRRRPARRRRGEAARVPGRAPAGGRAGPPGPGGGPRAGGRVGRRWRPCSGRRSRHSSGR
ncbi:class II fructose-bisphosphate aldolase [Streptomyces albidoflavus]|uniref:class II fructose-bisphosphate aldolase n=1 Tax=Streptomyces albidoflavus TaxID=1886 RepID=UPI00101E4DAF